MLDPRTVVWITVGFSIVGYAAWELLDFAPAKTLERYANRPLSPESLSLDFSPYNRSQGIEVIHTDLPCAYVTLSSVKNINRRHILRLYMGSLCYFVHP